MIRDPQRRADLGLPPLAARLCAYCGGEIPAKKRSDTKHCSRKCLDAEPLHRVLQRENNRRYREANPEKVTMTARTYREANRGKLAEKSRRYKDNLAIIGYDALQELKSEVGE